MSSYKLIIGIVRKGYAELISHSAVSVGATGGTILQGKGVAPSNILELFGFGESDKELLFTLTTSDKADDIIWAIRENTATQKKGFGVLFTLDTSALIKMGTITNGDKNMNETQYELLTVIVNKGFASDAMSAARKAGATGGTILNARGTAREGDEKFFGMDIVPEKELLMILTKTENEAAIREAIRALPCLSKPGSGIAFTCPADNFTLLGKK